MAIGSKIGNLYYLDVQEHTAFVSEELQHRCMRHASSAPLSNCEVCQVSKQTRKSFPKISSDNNHERLIQSDGMGPVEPASNSSLKYVVIYIVKETRFISVYPMRNKNEVVEKFQEFYNMITSKSSIVIKRLRSDNGGEFKNKRMKNLCDKLKVAQEFTVAYNPEQNGLAEWFNRTLVEIDPVYAEGQWDGQEVLG